MGRRQPTGRARPPRAAGPPHTHIATHPGEVWCWDVTFLPASIQGRWFYLYLILDLYSGKIVGFEVHDTDSAEHAAHLALAAYQPDALTWDAASSRLQQTLLARRCLPSGGAPFFSQERRFEVGVAPEAQSLDDNPSRLRS